MFQADVRFKNFKMASENNDNNGNDKELNNLVKGIQDMEINAEVAVEEEGAEVLDAAGGESDVQVS